jgi:hypothetical protein
MRCSAAGELTHCGVPSCALQAEELSAYLDAWEKLLPGTPINPENLRASDWAKIVCDTDLAAKLIAFKVRGVRPLLVKHVSFHK